MAYKIDTRLSGSGVYLEETEVNFRDNTGEGYLEKLEKHKKEYERWIKRGSKGRAPELNTGYQTVNWETVKFPTGTKVSYKLSNDTADLTVLESSAEELIGNVYNCGLEDFGVIHTDKGIIFGGDTAFKFAVEYPVDVEGHREYYKMELVDTKEEVRAKLEADFQKQLGEFKEKFDNEIEEFIELLFDEDSSYRAVSDGINYEEFYPEFDADLIKSTTKVRTDVDFHLSFEFESSQPIFANDFDFYETFPIPEDAVITLK